MKITCSIIEDLLQQYVDGILSDDSRRLVEDHLCGCEGCRQKVLQIRSISEELDEGAKAGQAPEGRSAAAEQGYGSFRRFRRWLKLRRTLTIILSVLITFCVACGGLFLMFDLESYMPYQKTGMYVNKDGKMFMEQPFYMYRDVYSGVDSSGAMIEVFYMTDTFQKRHLGSPTRIHIVDFGAKDDVTWTDENGAEEKNPPIDKVYYIAGEYVKNKHQLGLFDSHATLIPPGTSKDEELRIVNDVENNSILVWERSE